MTQFESTDARLAFPCWDEPACKATFELEMTYPKELICLSNTDPIGPPKGKYNPNVLSNTAVDFDFDFDFF